MNKHLVFAGIGLAIAALLIVIVLGHNRAEAPLVNDDVATEPELPGEATTTIPEVVTPPSDELIVAPKPVTPPASPTRGCVVGGCSSQLCVEEGVDVMTTCEWTAKYSCYQKATCERQTTGECGWTDNPALRQCLIDSENSEEAIELQN
jgi:hypothetical protein